MKLLFLTLALCSTALAAAESTTTSASTTPAPEPVTPAPIPGISPHTPGLGTAEDTIYGTTTLSDLTKDHLNVYGRCNLANMVINNDLNITGPLTATRLIVNGVTTVLGATSIEHGQLGNAVITGPANITECIIKDLRIIGPVTMQATKVSGQATLTGKINLTNCEFQNLNLTGEEVTLTNVVCNDINVNINNPGSWDVIVLDGVTTIKGTIKFTSGEGIVKIKNKEVFVGTVVGGTIQKEF